MKRVLVVNDEPACRDSLRMLLSLEGFEVEVAADGREALELAARFRPDVLVVDWVLKTNMDGLEVSESIQALNPEMHSVMVTGYPSVELEARVKALPGAQYLAKPFDPSDLIAAVRKAAAEGG